MLNESFAMILYSLAQETAVDADIRTGDETAGFGTGEENRGANQFLRFAETIHRRVRPDGFRAVSR